MALEEFSQRSCGSCGVLVICWPLNFVENEGCLFCTRCPGHKRCRISVAMSQIKTVLMLNVIAKLITMFGTLDETELHELLQRGPYPTRLSLTASWQWTWAASWSALGLHRGSCPGSCLSARFCFFRFLCLLLICLNSCPLTRLKPSLFEHSCPAVELSLVS